MKILTNETNLAYLNGMLQMDLFRNGFVQLEKLILMEMHQEMLSQYDQVMVMVFGCFQIDHFCYCYSSKFLNYIIFDSNMF